MFSRICGSQSSCAGVNASEAAAAVEAAAKNDGSETPRNCMCDDRCDTYGDCCTDSPYFDAAEQQSAAARYGCVRTDGGGGAYVVAKCPAAWTDQRVREACERPGGVERYGMLGNPVTGRLTGLAYRNRFCAACNGDAADPIVWGARLVCRELFDVVNGSEQAVLDTLRYDGDGNGRWTVDYQNKSYECDPAAVPPDATYVRPCMPDAVTACHPKWPDGNIRSKCRAYTTIVYYDGTPYKNVQCAICNHVLVQETGCESGVLHSRVPNQFGFSSFTALFLVQPGHRKCSNSDAYYDPFSKTCRPLLAAAGVPLNCSAMAVYTSTSSDWRPPAHVATEYVTLENGTLVACAADEWNTTTSPSEAFKSAALTYVGLGVSSVFLIVHLAVFAALPEMKNLSGKNLASFCVSLVCSYASFVTGNWLTGAACYVGAACTYYSFLVSFSWMLIMSFDCWRTLRLATVELRVTTGRQTKKFLVYSAVCWLVPAMMTFAAVAADAVPAVPDDVRPRFGADQCWFGSKKALLVFFAGPLTAIMAVNFTLFAWTAYMIHSSRATVRHVNTRHARRDFRMYCRLAVLMGLTWVTGIVASHTDSKYMWILFVVLNTFQGLFVFVAFTCRRRILNSLVGNSGIGGRGDGDVGRVNSMDPEKDHHHRHSNKNGHATPTSFSWSSSENGMPVSSEKTTDTLY